ncbi:hypothetical protein F5887DRAFT_1091446 [Amanita rubescens]|nr:hypothetical protein F5887DRAFT_1091446 [Amanita rubescens]
MSNAFRALSPSAYSSALVVDNAISSPEDRMAARHSTIAATSTIDQLVALVPPGWVEHLGPLIRDVGRCSANLVVKRKHHADLVLHKSKSTFPASFPKKRPVLQVSKEVRETDVGQAALKSVQTLVDTQRSDLLSEHIALALVEVQGMEALLTNEVVYKRLREALHKAAPVVKERRRYVLTEEVQHEDGTRSTNFKFATSPSFEAEFKALTQDLLPLALHAQLISESKARVADQKEQRKKEVKKTADAMDVDDDNDDAGPMKRLVDKAVDRRVKKLEKLQFAKAKLANEAGKGPKPQTQKKKKTSPPSSKAKPAAKKSANAQASSSKPKGPKQGKQGKGKGKGKGKAKAN